MTRRQAPRGADAGGYDLFGLPERGAGQIPPEAAPGESAETAVAVATLTETAKAVIEGAFSPLWVRGEVSDFKSHRNGHWYFTLRDGTAQIRCVVWSRDRRGIPAAPDDGMQVSALGQLSVYAARGEMQFMVRRMEAAGDGLWRKAFEQTRARLEADGLLAPERKRPIPRYPRRIAVITSPSGAALHDITAVVRRRAPGVEIVVVPAAVQGETAPAELVAALDRVGRWHDADLVIIGRGGGAREDLWAFNDEAVARALAACPLPTISAVGHEVDVTICDLVADLRAPTPSAAAEVAVRAVSDLAGEVRALGARLRRSVTARVETGRLRLHRAGGSLDALARRGVERRRARVQTLAGRLDALSPLATLQRGYAVARDDAGHVLASARQFAEGADFRLTVRDGEVRARATHIEEKA
ncbi:MAG TPA: exodeoxyribonuclease VII large subunit [Gemmatimonadaceae bacterium]|nr:exodeoxyribonuclease VII large subunit [Gemmatimonadaceae bacterium]